MAVKTWKGWINKQFTQDGRESIPKRIERETLRRSETKTKIKRAKKADRESFNLVMNS